MIAQNKNEGTYRGMGSATDVKVDFDIAFANRIVAACLEPYYTLA
jgi:hypothetical protein